MTRDPILVDLALQGGGSHGAFSWGVLDRLLEEPWLGIDGISGTSAGAMNAAVLADGYAKAGAAGARVALEMFWRRVSEAARFSPIQRGPPARHRPHAPGVAKVHEHTIAHVLGDEPAEAPHRLCDALLVCRSDFAQVLRVHSCGERRRADQV